MSIVNSIYSRLLDEEDNAEQQEQYCKVYDRNDFFTALVQIALALGALLSLYWKRLREVPRRTCRTWSLDIGKQGIGACYAHVLNMIIASIISQNIRGDTVLNDQCAWYGLSYLIDTTLGLVLAIICLNLLDKVAHQRDWTHLKHSGVYTGPNGLMHWVSQCFAWLLIQTIVKMIIYLFMWLFSDQLAWLGAILFAPIQFNIRFELVFVMILFPGFLNVIYFWIADSFLKAKPSNHSGEAFENDETGLEDKKQKLMADDDVEKQPAPGLGQPAPWSSYFGAYNIFGAPPTDSPDQDERVVEMKSQPTTTSV
ncbi:hypothetical protein MPSEU_000929400 [Mayamaea pseudoterrestris]|nr:hypothetical protein MPSEU_000929400 [Mayamaea pseudoterrestris]